MSKKIEKKIEIVQAVCSISVIKVDGRNMTKAIFKQLPSKKLFNECATETLDKRFKSIRGYVATDLTSYVLFTGFDGLHAYDVLLKDDINFRVNRLRSTLDLLYELEESKLELWQKHKIKDLEKTLDAYQSIKSEFSQLFIQA